MLKKERKKKKNTFPPHCRVLYWYKFESHGIATYDTLNKIRKRCIVSLLLRCNKNENLKLIRCFLTDTGQLSNASFACIPDIAFMDFNFICDGARQCVHISDEKDCGKLKILELSSLPVLVCHCVRKN